MTQISRPQSGQRSAYPDAGPYTAAEWRRIFAIELTGDDRLTKGPFYKFADGLAVSNPAGVTIRVASGAGLVNGHLLINEDTTDPEGNAANVDFTPSTPAAARIDRVVMVANNTDVAYSTNLEFPTDLTDYGGAAAIPARSARLAILTGVAGGAARSLVQDVENDGDIFMVELAQYTISAVPAVSGLSDERDFVDIIGPSLIENRTRVIFVPAIGGINETDNVDLEFYSAGAVPGATSGLVLPDDTTSKALGFFALPTDYVSNMTVKVILVPLFNGNCYGNSFARYGAAGDDIETHFDESGTAAVALTVGKRNAVQSFTLSSLAADDMIELNYMRVGDDVLDTINGDVYIMGWYVTYTADS